MIETQTALPEHDIPEAWSRLEASPLWAACTPSQRSFIVVLLATGDTAKSVQFAYNMKNASTARVFSFQLLKVEKIGELLAIARGERTGTFDRARLDLELKKTLSGIERELRFCTRGSTASQRLLSQKFSVLQALSQTQTPANAVSPSAQPDETFSVGEVVQQNGVAYRVTEIDDCGKILTAVDA